MRLSIIPELINSEEIELFDSRGIPVTICELSEFMFDYDSFKHPFLLIDNYEKEKYKKIEIKTINLDTLKQKGFRLVSQYATSSSRSYPRQNKLYLLEPLDSSFPKSEILSVMPNDHLIEFDITNNRVRIKGRNAFPYRRNENASQWVQVKDDNK